jgi:hypothetical protein
MSNSNCYYHHNLNCLPPLGFRHSLPLTSLPHPGLHLLSTPLCSQSDLPSYIRKQTSLNSQWPLSHSRTKSLLWPWTCGILPLILPPTSPPTECTLSESESLASLLLLNMAAHSPQDLCTCPSFCIALLQDTWTGWILTTLATVSYPRTPYALHLPYFSSENTSYILYNLFISSPHASSTLHSV